jgi:glutamine amidotransferase
MIAIIDYGMGNVGSIGNMFKKIGVDAEITSDLEKIRIAAKIVLPGVGSFDNGMRNLAEGGFIDILTKKVVDGGTPILGICLGMQLMTKRSDEGELGGLGWLDAETIKFRFDNEAGIHKVPHMGWNTVETVKPSRLFGGMFEHPRFYFVHSYYVTCGNQDDVLARTDYGFEFVSAFESGNVYGVQFHPEKSHKYGIKLLNNFAGL